MKYVITTAVFSDEDILSYNEGNKLNNGEKDDGYFYTSLRYFVSCYEKTKFGLFDSRAEAKAFARGLGLEGYKIRKFPFTI